MRSGGQCLGSAARGSREFSGWSNSIATGPGRGRDHGGAQGPSSGDPGKRAGAEIAEFYVGEQNPTVALTGDRQSAVRNS